MYETLKLEHEGPLAWLTLNRPKSLNALNGTMVAELKSYFSGLVDNRETRVVVLRGAGRAFCAGADLKGGTTESPIEENGALALDFILRAQRNISWLFVLMRRAPQPIIAAVHGAAAGGGFALALASDVCIAAESARMNAAAIRIGLSACDVGLSYFLPRVVGRAVAAELLLTGNFIDAARAERLGLVSRVVPDGELEGAARALAQEMIRNSPIGVRLTKECLNAAVDATSLEQVISLEDSNQVICARSRDYREGVAAFLEKRAPSYRGG